MSNVHHILLCSTATLLLSCAGGQATMERDLSRLQEQVRELQLEAAKGESRIVALERQLDLLVGRRGERPTDEVAAGAPIVLPEGLEVVRMTPPPLEEEDDDSFAFISLAPQRATPPAAPAVAGRTAEKAPPLPTAVELGLQSQDLASYEDYEAGLRALSEGRAEAATTSLQAFLRQHPQDQLADNALVSLGEAWLLRRMPGLALEAFERVAVEYPAGDAVPLALLRYGETSLALGRAAAARAAFNRLIDRFPESPATTQARGRLALLEEGES